MTNLEQTIQLYRDNGAVLIPLRDKVPITPNWQKLTQEMQPDLTGATSVGWVIPESCIVVDVDNHGEDLGTQSLKKMSEHYGFDLKANAGIIIKTASGGLHLYYRRPKNFFGKTVKNSLANFPSVEFKSVKRQVVIPGSKLSDGRTYGFHMLSRSFEDLIELPEKIMLDITAKQTGVKLAKSTIGEDAYADIKAFEDFLGIQTPSTPGDRSNNLYIVACFGKDQGLSEAKVLDLLLPYDETMNHPPMGRGRVISTVKHAFSYSKNKEPINSIVVQFPENVAEETQETLTLEQSEKQQIEVGAWREALIVNKAGVPSRTSFGARNTEIYLKNLPQFRGCLGVNAFSMDTVWRKKAKWHKENILTGVYDRVLDDDDVLRIRAELNDVGFDPSVGQVLEAARSVSLQNEYHPVKEYFESLPEWDGVERLKMFFPSYCGADDDAYTQQVGVKMFTAIVARIYTPGCKFDYLPILIGEQGIGKSTLLETIAINPQWYTDNLGDITNKDVILRMRSKLIVENAELTMFDKTDPNTVKAFLSRRVDRDRMPYDRLPRDLPRQCVIIATTNKDRFLQDETGNRRMWPVEVHRILSSEIKRNLPMFYAEAIYRFKHGEQLFLDSDAASAVAVTKQAERYNSDEWEGKISKWIEDNSIDKTTTAVVWDQCMGRDIVYCTFREQRRIGNVLRHLGWKRSTVHIDGKNQSGFKK